MQQNKKIILQIIIMPLVLSLFPKLLLAQNHETKTITFEPRNGEAVEAIQGYFDSPVRHEKPNGAQLRLSYVRFPSTNPNPGNPIVYLAGGPGGPGSGTAKGRRFALFMALREVADVIAFDQRGTGYSNQTTPCKREEKFPLDQVLSIKNITQHETKAIQKCIKEWRAQGHDVDAYNTWQSAGDLAVLKNVLGAEKINLWGISYGTHLALAAMKRDESIIDRSVLTGMEGLDQTVKMPAHTNSYLTRVQEAINAQEEAQKMFPDIAATMRRVHEKYNNEPLVIETQNPATGAAVQLRMDGSVLQLITSFMFIKNPENVARLPGFYTALDNDNTAMMNFIATGMLQQMDSDIYLMPTAMDIASGITKKRLKQINKQAPDAVLGNVMNFPMPHLAGQVDIQDLGDKFRKDPVYDGEVLILTGTLDGRTYPEATQQIMKGLKNAEQIMVVNAGHDLFMSDPKITEIIVAYFARKELPYKKVTLEPPSFVQ